MRAIVVALALVACSTLANAAPEAHLHDMRERLGHFGHDGPFLDLYKFYAAAFVKPFHRERPNDDYRNYMPSAEECLSYFIEFRMTEYVVKDFEEIALLDGCLGYLFSGRDDRTFDEEASESQRAQMDVLRSDVHLKKLYFNTKVEELDDPAKICIADLIGSAIVAKHQFKDEVCNNMYLQLFIQFAECQDRVPELFENHQEDEYLKMVYEVLKKRAQQCFHAEIATVDDISRREWKKNKFVRAYVKTRHMFSTATKKALRQPTNTVKRFADERMYPPYVEILLRAVQNTKDQINPRQIHQVLRGVYKKDQRLVKQFLENFALFVNKVETDRPKTKQREANNIYRKLVDKVCQKFRISTDPNAVDLATPFIRLVRLLHHEKVFGISEKEFIHHCLTEAYESAVLYLSVSSCNLLEFTEAALVQENPAVSEYSYRVNFVPDTSKMLVWPVADYY